MSNKIWSKKEKNSMKIVNLYKKKYLRDILHEDYIVNSCYSIYLVLFNAKPHPRELKNMHFILNF